jgi:hypothetical protein
MELRRTRVNSMAVGPLRDAMQMAAELARLPKERRRARPAPPKDGLVVDLGAGHAPFTRADLVVDKYVEDDFERGFALSRAKPLVVADGHHLPFENDSFAYLIAAHVVEHAIDPARFACEISRVAARGFVQVPTQLAERVFGWQFHPWLIDKEDDVLVFRPKEPGERSVGEPMHDLFDESFLLRLVFFSRQSIFHHSLHWRGGLRVRVLGTSQAERTAELDVERTLAALRRNPAPPLPARARALLCCPSCQGLLDDVQQTLECLNCDRAYPVIQGAPLLIDEAAS